MVILVEPTVEEAYLLAILDSPDGIDLAEFAVHDPRNDDGCYRLYDYQWGWFSCRDTYQIDQGGRSLGKELALDTLVATPGGWTTMGDIRVGDVVYDEGGYPTRVIQVHPVRHGLACYEVVFSDGSVVTASGRHLWRTWDKAARKSAWRGGVIGPQVRTTDEIRQSLKYKTEFNHSIPLADALQAADRPMPLDPWVLGYWLGNGTKMQPYITVGQDDLAYVEGQFAARSFKMKRLTTTNRSPQLRFDPADGNGMQALHDLAVVGDKHIPSRYQRASEPQRRQLLAGIFDSDGHMTKNGHAEITLTNQRLARDVVDLLWTLGEKPTITEERATIAGVDKGPKWRISWTPREDPALMPRKSARFRGHPGTTAATHRRIVDVRPIRSVPVRCITVDAPSHMYLVGRQMIATHNTESIKLRALAFPFYRPGKGMLISAPELNHLRPLTDEVEKMLLNTRIVREMLPTGKGAGIARQPHWQCRFKNGASIISRLPNKDGRGVKGQHVDELHIDEAQDYPQAGWREIVETLNAGSPDAMWRCHGVSRGVRDSFFEKTQQDSGWTVHRPMAMNRPSWTKTERDSKVIEYGGSRQAVDYRRNIYGEHGDASNSVFVLAKLMAIVDLDEGSTYNSDVYTCAKIEYERFPINATDDERAALLMSWINLPGEHFNGYSQRVGNREVGSPKGYSAYWAGMDVGVTNHPSEILVFGQRTGSDFLELLLRVQMHRINTDDQMLVVERLFALYGSRLRLGIDKTGVGFMLWDQLTRRPCGANIYGFGFSEKRVVAIEDRPLEPGETIRDLAKMRNVVEAGTDWLRNDYVDAKKFRLPYDREVLIEFQGQSYSIVRDNGDPYGVRRAFAGGSFHTLDAAKIMMATKHIPPLEELLDAKPAQPVVLDVFMGA